MKTSAFYHRTESEYAFLYQPDEFVVRLRTAKNDVAQVFLYYGDPFDQREDTQGVSQWHYQTLALNKSLQTQDHQYWEVRLQPTFNRLQYGFVVLGLDQTQIFYGELGCAPVTPTTLQTMGNYFRLPYFHDIDRVPNLDWIHHTVWYQIFPERFANGDPNNDPAEILAWDINNRPGRDSYYGGDLQGILDHLDYLQALGFNGLYLTPIFKANSNHKYDTVDYFEIDPEFGDKRTLKRLIDGAHQRGMKVMLDAVFNHIGDQSTQWQDVLTHQAQSQFKNWFHIHHFPVTYEATANFEVGRHLSYETFAYNPHMPKFNTADPAAAAYLLSVARYWIEQFDIDAWRLDVADEVDHHFWRQFTTLCRSLKPDFYILGEAWHNAGPWLNGPEFSGVMNYQLTDLVTAKFLTKTISNSDFIARLNQATLAYRDQTNELVFNLLGSHDTPRVLTVAQHNLAAVQAAFAFMFCQKGTPCVYYGDEIGMVGGPDPDNRRPMIWQKGQQNQKMQQFMQALIQFKKDYALELAQRPVQWENSEASDLLQFSRPGATNTLQAYFNTSQTPQTLTIDPAATILLSQGGQLNNKTYQLEPDGFVIFRQTK
ncbi:glycoside hydrolase family 13 protein [Agrilactobacillus yilanensis]|uniref:Glycoside hydrolase family 13 protein n=1 Tax=Agrilactobacillus yilanensis TaxID=2485997 RepID=A0ABW4J8N9_9LACO|nr:glycoside hydrolase family 13 protein [Agrilactobacillus yilanensis]